MKSRRKEIKMKKDIRLKLILIFALLVLFAFMDVIMLEKVYKPISASYNINWGNFEINIFGANLLWWSVAFFVLIFSVYIILGIAFKDWKVSVSGVLLFLTGWEDLFYYFIQGQWIPAQLEWLDSSPITGLGRFFGGHVSSLSLIITSLIGAFLVFLIFRKDFLRK